MNVFGAPPRGFGRWVSLIFILSLARPVMPPDLAKVQQVGCAVKQQGHDWYVRPWVNYRGETNPQCAYGNPKRDWETLFAVRHDRKRALLDCQDWLKAFDKSYAHALKEAKE